MLRRILTFALVAAASPALADPRVTVQQAWARAPAGSGDAVSVYMTLRDQGSADRLVGASADVAGMAMLHESIEQNGVARMEMVDAVPLPAGGTVTLRPGGLHLMLTDLTRKLRAGDSFQLTLSFQHSPAVTTIVPVLPPGAPGPPSFAAPAN